MQVRHVAAIYVAKPARAQEIADVLRNDAVDTIVATSSDEFYQLLNYQQVDFVVIENELRGFLCGLDILERLYQDLVRPKTILLATPTNETRERAKALGIDVVLPPASSIAEIQATFEGVLFKNRVQQIHINPHARKIVRQCGDLKPLPQVLMKALSYLDLDETNVSLAKFTEEISVDPTVTAHILKLTNSSLMGFRRKFTNLLDAVNLLGVRRTVSLIVSASAIDNHAQLSKGMPPADRIWYNRRSVMNASTAYTFAKRMEQVSPDTAFILGLLQDIGIVVMANVLGGNYVTLLRRVRDIGPLRLDVVERQELEFCHADVSAALLHSWGLPQSLVSIVHAHHEPKIDQGRSKTEQRFLFVMQLGEALANLTDGHAAQRFGAVQRRLAEYGPASAATCKACIAESIAKAVESSQLFALPVPKDDVLQGIVDNLNHSEYREVEGDGEAEALAEPEAEAKVDTAAVANVAGPPAGDEAEVLVAVMDDDPTVVNVIRMMLATVHVGVVQCDSFADLEKHLDQVRLVMMDVHMPGDGGIRMTERLRRDGYRGPIIMVTGDRSRETVTNCIMAGANDYLAKPFSTAVLIEKVQRHAQLAGPVLAEA